MSDLYRLYLTPGDTGDILWLAVKSVPTTKPLVAHKVVFRAHPALGLLPPTPPNGWSGETTGGYFDVIAGVNALLGDLSSLASALVTDMTETELREDATASLSDHRFFRLAFDASYTLFITTLVEAVVSIPDGSGGTNEEVNGSVQPSPLGELRALFRINGEVGDALAAELDVTSAVVIDDVTTACADALTTQGGLSGIQASDMVLQSVGVVTQPPQLEYDPLTMGNFTDTVMLRFNTTQTVRESDLSDYTAIAADPTVSFSGFTTA